MMKQDNPDHAPTLIGAFDASAPRTVWIDKRGHVRRWHDARKPLGMFRRVWYWLRGWRNPA